MVACVSCSPVWYEPTDVKKATKPWLEGRGDAVTFASPNLDELRALCSYLRLGESYIPDQHHHALHQWRSWEEAV